MRFLGVGMTKFEKYSFRFLFLQPLELDGVTGWTITMQKGHKRSPAGWKAGGRYYDGEASTLYDNLVSIPERLAVLHFVKEDTPVYEHVARRSEQLCEGVKIAIEVGETYKGNGDGPLSCLSFYKQ